MKSGLGRILFLFWLLVSSSGLVLAQDCPYGKTAFVWANGILVPDSKIWQDFVDQIKARFMASNPGLSSSCVEFKAVHNQSSGLLKTLLGRGDINQAIDQIGMQEVDKYLNDLNLLNQQSQAHKSFMAAALGFQDDQFKADSDLATLDQVVLDFWSKGYYVVLVGHSQGNFYANLEYGIRLRNADGKSKQLPNANYLSVVGIATPANNVADGRQKYTTHCNDFIHFAPAFVRVPESAMPWNVRDSLLSCITTYVVVPSLSLGAAALNAVNVGYSVKAHLLPTYMTDNSNTQKQIFQHLEDSLPDPGCGGDTNCYLKDSFRSADYTGNWLQTSDSATISNSTAIQSAGVLLFNSHTYLFSGGGMYPATVNGSVTLRTRRVFVGPVDITFFINTNIGGGKSIFSLKKALKDSTILALTIDSVKNSVETFPNLVTINSTASNFGGWKLLTITKTNNTVSMSVGGATWSVASDLMDGLYLEIESQGDNTLHVKDLSVVRTAAAGLQPPPTLIPTCSANPAVITAGQSTVFTGSYTGGTGAVSGVWGKVVSGSGTTATYATTTSTPAGFGSATFTVTDSGSPKQAATANCSVQINAPVLPSVPGALSSTSLATESSLLWYASFNNNTNDSKGTNNGVPANITYVAGKHGQAASFNGSNSHITLPTPISFLPSKQFSVVVWTYQTFAKYADILVTAKDTLLNRYKGYEFALIDSQKVRVYVDGADTAYFTGNTVLSLNTWHHVAITYDGVTMKIYVDGVLDNSGAVPASVTDSYGNSIVGAFFNDAYGANFNGSLDDLAIFNRPLTSTEVSMLYGGGGGTGIAQPPSVLPQQPPTPTPGNIQTLNPVANTPFDITVTNATNFVLGKIQAWVFDTGACTAGCRHPDSLLANVTASGMVLQKVQLAAGDHYLKFRNTDSGAWSNASATFTVAPAVVSGPIPFSQTSLALDPSLMVCYSFNGNTNTCKGTNNATPTNITYSSGKFEQAANFNGSSSHIIPTSPISFTAKNFSIIFWLYQSQAKFHQIFTTNKDLGANNYKDYEFVVLANQKLRAYVDGGNTAIFNGNTAIPLNSWHHVAITYDGVTMRSYINGVLDNSAAIAPSVADSFGNFIIGAWYGNAYGINLAGSLDDFAVFSRPLTASEVATLYGGGGTATVTQPTQPTQPTTGTVNNSVSGYSRTILCTLNGVSISAPSILTNQDAGSKTLVCTPPPGYNISSITPTQILQGGGTVNFVVSLVIAPSVQSISGNCTSNGSNSAISLQAGNQITWNTNVTGGVGSYNYTWSISSVNAASVALIPTSAATYNASVTVSDSGSPKQQITLTCPQVTVTNPAPPPLSVSWFTSFPVSPKTTDTITLNFTGTGFNSSTQVWVYGLNCVNGCQAGVVASSITTDGKSMQALAQLRNVDNFQVKVRSGSNGNFILAGTVPVR